MCSQHVPCPCSPPAAVARNLGSAGRTRGRESDGEDEDHPDAGSATASRGRLGQLCMVSAARALSLAAGFAVPSGTFRVRLSAV